MTIANIITDITFAILFFYVMFQVNKQLGSFFEQVGVEDYPTRFLALCLIIYFIVLISCDITIILSLFTFLDWINSSQYKFAFLVLWDVRYFNDFIF